MLIGKRLAEIRMKAKLTQEEVAELIGVTFETVRSWESNESVPDEEMLSKISKALNVPLKDLLDPTFGLNCKPTDERLIVWRFIRNNFIVYSLVILAAAIYITYAIYLPTITSYINLTNGISASFFTTGAITICMLIFTTFLEFLQYVRLHLLCEREFLLKNRKTWLVFGLMYLALLVITIIILCVIFQLYIKDIRYDYL